MKWRRTGRRKVENRDRVGSGGGEMRVEEEETDGEEG